MTAFFIGNSCGQFGGLL
ncbi:MAG: hypothetical protein E7525_00465 [Ruminococcaceae bacterium]|nr:hypothetical protein [Oscillospiraceae bacterium]